MSDEASAESQTPAKRRRRSWVWLILAVVIVGGAAAIFLIPRGAKRQQAGKTPEARPVPVDADVAHQGDIGVSIEALGTVTPVYTVNVTSRVQGQIMRVDYREGQAVHAGDSLVEIDPRPYQAALTQAEGQLAHDEGLLRQARIDLARYRKAYAHDAIPKQQLDDQVQLVFQDQGTVKADQGALETARVNLAYCHIASPIDGRVGLRLVDPGNMVQANSATSLVVVTQVKPITVIFSVSEDYLPEILASLRKGQTMEVDAYDRTQQKRLAIGTLLTLDNQVDTTTGTVRLRAEFANADEGLFPNQFVNAKLKVKTEKNQTLVSVPAIQRNAQGTFVYVITSQHTAEMRQVQVGASDGVFTAVRGVRAGETVAVDGFEKLQQGAQVSVRHELAGTAAP